MLRLESVCRLAVEYVGSANYQHREDHALSEVSRCFTEAKASQPKLSEIMFREENGD